MSDLPKDSHVDYLFNFSGFDLSGSFLIKLDNRKKSVMQTVYICFVFKAIHIEIVSDLTAESFTAVLKRFVTHIGRYSKLY